MATHYIGADVDCKSVEVAVERGGRIVKRERIPTTIPALRGFLAEVPGRKEMVFEEGGLAGWLYRNLRHDVDRLVICDPRRNKLITHDGEKSDRIDAAKLATLLRGGFLREVYHSTDERRLALKEAVALYHDRVREAVRQGHKLRARCWMYGVRPPGRAARRRGDWMAWLSAVEPAPLADSLRILWIGFEAAARQSRLARRQMDRLAQGFEIVRLWKAWPGMGPVRSATLLAYLDTPWRFRSAKALWKYCGIGLQKFQTGTGRDGRPRPPIVKMTWRCNRRLKDAVMGAATSAIRQGRNVFAEAYAELVKGGMIPSNARHTVARRMLTGMWGQWKSLERDARDGSAA